jgi:hypothetical protein
MIPLWFVHLHIVIFHVWKREKREGMVNKEISVSKKRKQ